MRSVRRLGTHSLRKMGPLPSTLAIFLAALVLPSFFLGPLHSGAFGGGSGSAVAPLSVPGVAAPFPTPIRHVIVIFLENQERSDVQANGSFERYLESRYASSSNYYSIMHYSLPNYLAVTSGYTTNLFSTLNQRNVGDLLQGAGRTWGGFMESMPTPCDTIATSDYTEFHNPFVAYQDIVNKSSRCTTHDVNLTAFSNDVAGHRVPNYAFISPNLTHDAHNTNVSVADRWLSGFLSPIVNDSFFSSTAIFVTYDEGTTNLGRAGHGAGGGNVYLSVLSPYARPGYNSTIAYNHYDLLTTTEWLLGLGHTGTNDNWTKYPPMKDLFNFTPSFSVTGQVHSHSGKHLANALVFLANGTNVTTNAAGSFSFSLPNGSYSLTANETGYYNQTISVTVNGAPVRAITFRLVAVP
ncbi:MAG: alkaline phosphatase family protein [Candidatus Lutacidiplasmatales archaeon]